MNPFDESTLCQTSATLVFANIKLKLKKTTIKGKSTNVHVNPLRNELF